MIKFNGIANNTALFFQNEQLMDRALWAKFVDQFRVREDGDNNGWRGEYWGKMMRGGALIYGYTRDRELYRVLTDSVKDMMTAADPDGRVSSFTRETEFRAWDMWCRKYVLLGCEYYLDYCEDGAFKAQVTEFLRRHTDYIMDHIGKGKLEITRATNNWLGVNSTSILEPVVKLYKLTGDKKYLDFASYIVETGGADGVNVFEAAYKNEVAPYQYGVSKAYELTSLFEGLLEYYLVTGIEKYRTAVINYAYAVMDTEVSIIGSCGVTHELFDHTRTRQTVIYDGVVQETCVTVTWMKFCSRLLELTGDSRFADEMERSFYNAYLGALNVNHRECKPISSRFDSTDIVSTFLPVDSYSPLVPGLRGQKVGGSQILSDKSYYGCCACISAAGAGVFLRSALTQKDGTVTLNFFESGRAETAVDGVKVTLDVETGYPVDGKVRVSVKAERPVRFTLAVRNPGWADGAHGYTRFEQEWSDDTVELSFDMPLKLHYPEKWDKDVIYTEGAKNDWGCHYCKPVEVVHDEKDDAYIAVTRGPLTLAADSRTGKPADSAFDLSGSAEREKNEIVPGAPCMVRFGFTAADGERFSLVDYGSAGRDWQTVIAAWLPTK